MVLFIRLALLGAALGLGFGLVTSLWLANIWNDPGLEIVLTLGAAYACYFVAEELAGASGLLAVVVMGFTMSLIGERRLKVLGYYFHVFLLLLMYGPPLAPEQALFCLIPQGIYPGQRWLATRIATGVGCVYIC